jgi:hypothetical protein
MTEHTPSPWQWHWRFEDGIATGSVFSELHEGHAYAVAICPRLQMKDQWEADARLIVAAPEMLSLLKELIDIEGPQPGTSEWAKKVRGVIAQATQGRGLLEYVGDW